MADLTLEDRIIFHDAIETMEVDFRNMTFRNAEDVDAFYDEADRRLAATGRRWYFLIGYAGCVIAPEAWDRFALRGKNTNVAHGLGTVRLGPSEETLRVIREQAGAFSDAVKLWGEGAS